jgi:[lysine-biosynthesis-protein LysW]--L-2-aminoadipate ligase
MTVATNGTAVLKAGRITKPHIGLLITYLRDEEKLILKAARRRGIEITTLLERQLVLDMSAPTAEAAGVHVDVVLDRCVAHLPAGYALRTFERWGIPTINPAAATAICDDKALCSIALERAGVRTPRTLLAFSVESALAACDQIGYPAVLKPVTGSWGRLLTKVNGPEQAKVILEQKKELGSMHHSIFYVQEYLEKPGRDIRAFVIGDHVIAASYRTSEHWITNTARGATSVSCPVTPEIEHAALSACKAVGARWAGVDLIELEDGFTCVEVNTGGEFHGLMRTTERDIAAEIVDELLLAFRVRGDFGLAFT